MVPYKWWVLPTSPKSQLSWCWKYNWHTKHSDNLWTRCVIEVVTLKKSIDIDLTTFLNTIHTKKLKLCLKTVPMKPQELFTDLLKTICFQTSQADFPGTQIAVADTADVVRSMITSSLYKIPSLLNSSFCLISSLLSIKRNTFSIKYV